MFLYNTFVIFVEMLQFSDEMKLGIVQVEYHYILMNSYFCTTLKTFKYMGIKSVDTGQQSIARHSFSGTTRTV